MRNYFYPPTNKKHDIQNTTHIIINHHFTIMVCVQTFCQTIKDETPFENVVMCYSNHSLHFIVTIRIS
jgi:hypothetical protein